MRGYGGVLALWEVAQTLMRAATRAVRSAFRPRAAAAAARLGVRASVSSIGFGSAEEAIAYANAHPVPASEDLQHVEPLFQPPGSTREVGAGLVAAIQR